MLKKHLSNPVLILLMLLLSVNVLFCFLPYLGNLAPGIFHSKFLQPIGFKFECLRPYLRHVRKAGYYTYPSLAQQRKNLYIMKDFGEAQYVVSPTIFDFERPWDYEYVVFLLYDGRNSEAFMIPQDYKVLISSQNQVFLLKKVSS